MSIIICALLWFSIVSAAIMAGVYFTFSVFAMRAFAALGDAAGAQAMQSINRVIVKSAFLPLFMLSTAACAALIILGMMGYGGAGATTMAIGGAIYVIGMFVVTIAGNVPLNNKLDAADPTTEEGVAVWRDYLQRWTRLNHIRTLSCIAAMALLVVSLSA